MTLNKYFVKFNVDGRPGGEIIVEARDSSAAKRMAMAEIKGRPGYADKRIYVQAAQKVR